ncbi:MAG: hypothetical protein OXC96_10150 [Cyanobacteria bacterium MAG CAR1_bin_15]|nr:hypothetical protein [Cyanobacteria bacterium MAG CAR1_bin_15]
MRNPWRQWREHAIASPIVTALVIALVSIDVVGFQSLKGDIRNTEARLREEIQASEARQREDIRALSDKLDRVLESLLAARS